MKGRIVGIGGIFFKSKDTAHIKQWYHEHLGIKTDQWGAPFVSRKFSNPDGVSFLQWSPFAQESDYFGTSGQEFMINYRVENIEALVEELKQKGTTICDEIATYDYGKFVHIEDGDGRKVELWEPVDEVFASMYNKDALNTE